MMKIFYDIEILPSLFLIIFKDKEGKVEHFQISPYKNQTEELVVYLQQLYKNECTMIGYNNTNFDYPLLVYFLQLYEKDLRGRDMVKMLFNKAQDIINTKNKNKIRIENPDIRQIDLMTVNSFDNEARSVSLDALKFVFHKENISQLNKNYLKEPVLTKEQIQEVIEYCIDDIDATIELYDKSSKVLYVRDNLPEKFKHLYNYNDIGLGVEQLLQEYCEVTGQNPNQVRWDTTTYDKIALKDVIYDYLPKHFENVEPFNRFIKWLYKQEVDANALDGAFTKLPDHVVEEIKDDLFIEYTKGLIKKITLRYKDYLLTYGMGGLHSSGESKVWDENEEYCIISSDASSFHPSNISVNKLYQKHLGIEFNQLYTGMLNERLEEKKKPKEQQNIAIIEGKKLNLNVVFGKSLGDYGFLSDKLMGLKITINNQLMISLLTVLHCENIPEIKLIDSNTDGNYYLIPRSKLDLYFSLCEVWEKITNITLEHSYFKKIVMRDGNNYIAVTSDGKLKKKGLFEDKPDFYKNHSFLIIPKALQAYYIDNIPIEEFIKKHECIYDFFGLAKSSKGSYTELQEAEYKFKIGKKGQQLKTKERIVLTKRKQPKLLRFYVSTDGYELIKILPPLEKNKGTVDYKKRELAFEGTKGYLVTGCNVISSDTDFSNINYDYYINECYKIINVISKI